MKVTEVTGKLFRVLTDATNDIWSRMSFWTRLSDVHHNDDTSLYDHVRNITGISSSLTSNSTTTVASAACAVALEQQLNSISKTIITNKQISFTGGEVDFIIPVDGIYKFELYGAQGSNYNTFIGGLGGYVCAQKYFTKGTKLKLKIGGQNGFNKGGAGTISNGGGATEVKSYNGTVLLCAGGGGGAGAAGTGHGGGTTDRNTTTDTGEPVKISYGAGGGGGYKLGGKFGYAVLHYHSQNGCSYTPGGPPCGYGGTMADGKTYAWMCPQCGNLSYGSQSFIACGTCPPSPGTWSCGKSDGQVISSVPAGGGTNYIDSSFSNTTSTPSVNTGDGKIVVNLL